MADSGAVQIVLTEDELEAAYSAWLEDVFSYHKPEGDRPAKYERIRGAAKEFARVILSELPACADRSAALRHIREAVMTANAAVALKGRV